MLLLSLFMILLFGLALSLVCKFLRIPALIGYLAVGIILGPYVLNLIDPKILAISSELRKIALIIILIKAGLSLNITDLKKIGRPAILMAFLPAIIEMFAIGLLAPIIFGISYLDAFILGCILGAVSPAVVVPRMVAMIDEKQGTEQGIPQLIVAGSSIDDVVVIVIFTALMTIATGGTIGVMTYLNIPISIFSGSLLGVLIGLFLVWFFNKVHIRDTIKVIIILAISLGLVAAEELLTGIVGFSGLISIISMGMVILYKYRILAERLTLKFSKLWVFAEILLFVMLGATVNITLFVSNLGFGILLILGGLALRSLGVLLSLIKTHLSTKERLFCTIAYTPKATVQAAIGGIPLAMGLISGDLLLSIAVVAILFTAPVGAFLIDISRDRLVPKQQKPQEL